MPNYEQTVQEILRWLREEDNIGSKFNRMADDCRRNGDWETAIAYCERSREISIDDEYARGVAFMHLGGAHHARGDLDQAVAHYLLARTSFELENEKHGEGIALMALGTLYQASEKWEQAMGAYEQSYKIFNALGKKSQAIGDTKKARWYEGLANAVGTRSNRVREASSGAEVSPYLIRVAGATAAGEPIYALDSHMDESVGTMVEFAEVTLDGKMYELLGLGKKTKAKCAFHPGSEYFACEVKGSSMIEEGIRDGDRVLVRKQERIEQGEIAVFLIESESGSETVIKRYRREGERIYLVSANPDFKPRVFEAESKNLHILGKVVAILRDVEQTTTSMEGG